MACKKQGVLFSGTKEQEAALKEVISELKGTKGALMPIMQKAQDATNHKYLMEVTFK